MFEPLAAPDSFPQSAARRHGACLRDRRESSKHPTPYVFNPLINITSSMFPTCSSLEEGSTPLGAPPPLWGGGLKP